MTDRKKLIDLLDDFPVQMEWHDNADLANYLLSNGVRLEKKQATSDKTSEENKRWIPVTEGLPENDKPYEEYLVNIMADHYPVSTWDDDPYCEEYVTVAQFDDKQKIWYLHGGNTALNALILPEDSRVNSESVTHWMPLPEPPKED